MPVVKYKNAIEKLLKNPVIKASDFTKLGVKKTYVRRLAELLRARGRIVQIEKGKYATTKDPFLIAPFITFPSYISMFSALFLRKVLLQVPSRIQVVTTAKRKKKRINFLGTEIEFFRIKPRLLFGYEFLGYENRKIPVANVEKAIIDLAYFGFEPSGEIIGKVNKKRLEEYLKLVNKKSVETRVRRWLNAFSE